MGNMLEVDWHGHRQALELVVWYLVPFSFSAIQLRQRTTRAGMLSGAR